MQQQAANNRDKVAKRRKKQSHKEEVTHIEEAQLKE